MTASFGIPFGPTFNPLYEPEGAYFWDDFIGYVDGAVDVALWADVSTSGTAVASASEPWGAVAIASGSDAGDDGGIELNGEPFAFDHTKDLLFICQLKTSSITGGNIFAGLHTEGFDIGSGASIVSTHIGFITRGAASIEFSVGDGSSQTIKDTSVDLVANTYVILVWKWNAASGILSVFVNGVKRSSLKLATDALPATGTQMTLGLHNEFQSAASTLTVDYVGVAGER